MSRANTYIAALLVAVMAASVGYAAGPVSLKGFIVEAVANNPELRSMREAVRGSEAGVRAHGSLEDPSLKVEMMGLARRHPLTNGPGNAMQTRYTVSQEFPFPGKLSLKEKAASLEAAGARSALEAKALEVAALVKDAYFDYAYLAETIKTNADIASILSYTAKIAETRYSTGLAPQQDVIKARIEETLLTGEVLSVKAGMEGVGARLKYLLGRTQDGVIEIDAELTDERVRFNSDELIAKAVSMNPEIKMAERTAEAAEANADLERRVYYPDLMAGVAPVQQDGRFDAYDLMFQINIPIWFGKYESRTSEAGAFAVAKRGSLLAERNLKAFEVKQASIDVDTADKILLLYTTGIIPQTRTAFDSALKNYQAGKIDFLTLIDAERALKKTRLDYLATLLDYRKKVAALELAVGADF